MDYRNNLIDYIKITLMEALVLCSTRAAFVTATHHEMNYFTTWIVFIY